MPIVRCQKDGKAGFRVDAPNMKCHLGPEGKKKAQRQLAAIKISQSKGKSK